MTEIDTPNVGRCCINCIVVKKHKFDSTTGITHTSIRALVAIHTSPNWQAMQ